MNFSTLVRSISVIAALIVPAGALELRQWTLINGTVFDGELVRPDGENVIIKDKTGRPAPYEIAKLSFADRDYIKEYAPKDNKAGNFGDAKAKELKVPLPAREVKIDTKQFKKAEKMFELPSSTLMGLETPHFIVMYLGKEVPVDIAETAERLWFDFKFLHPTFEGKFEGRKMAVFIMEEGEAYDELGEWLAQQMTAGGQGVDGANLLKTWKLISASAIPLPNEVAEKYKLFKVAQMFKKQTGAQKREKGVWVSFNVHCLARTLMDIAGGGGTSSFAAEGSFALLKGFPFFKEIQLTGKSQTSTLNVDDDAKNKKDEVTSTGALGDMRQVAKDTEDLVKKNKISLEKLYKLKSEEKVTREDYLLAHAFVRFLNKNNTHMEAFAQLIKKVDSSSQLPSLEEIATDFGYADVVAMEKAFQIFISGPEFKKQ